MIRSSRAKEPVIVKAAIPTVVLLTTLAGVVAILTAQRRTTSELRSQISAVRSEPDALPQLKSERHRLQERQRAIELRNASERSMSQHESSSPHEEKTASSSTSLATGQWLPHTAWKNRGRATPAATLETIFWAAVGGDLVTLKDTLLPDEEVRARAETLFLKLPERSRSVITAPEELITATVGRSIPLGEARVVWQQQSEPDVATLCVLMKRTPTAAPQEPPLADLADPAPTAPEIKTAFLTLRRSDEHGWRLVVKQR